MEQDNYTKISDMNGSTIINIPEVTGLPYLSVIKQMIIDYENACKTGDFLEANEIFCKLPYKYLTWALNIAIQYDQLFDMLIDGITLLDSTIIVDAYRDGYFAVVDNLLQYVSQTSGLLDEVSKNGDLYTFVGYMKRMEKIELDKCDWAQFIRNISFNPKCCYSYIEYVAALTPITDDILDILYMHATTRFIMRISIEYKLKIRSNYFSEDDIIYLYESGVCEDNLDMITSSSGKFGFQIMTKHKSPNNFFSKLVSFFY